MSNKKRYEIDIKWAQGGSIAPILKDLKVVDVYGADDRPSGYAYICFIGTEKEFEDLHSRLIADERFFKVIGIHEPDEEDKPNNPTI